MEICTCRTLAGWVSTMSEPNQCFSHHPTPHAVLRPMTHWQLFAAFVMGHLGVHLASAVLGFVLIWLLLYIAFIGWVPFLLLAVAMLATSRRVPRLRWAGLGVLSGTAALYIPLVVGFVYQRLTEAQTAWAIVGGSLMTITVAAITAAVRARKDRARAGT